MTVQFPPDGRYTSNDTAADKGHVFFLNATVLSRPLGLNSLSRQVSEGPSSIPPIGISLWTRFTMTP